MALKQWTVTIKGVALGIQAAHGYVCEGCVIFTCPEYGPQSPKAPGKDIVVLALAAGQWERVQMDDGVEEVHDA